jgi:hypothetical protein
MQFLIEAVTPQFGRRRDWNYFWNRRITDFVELRPLADTYFAQLDHRRVYVQCRGRDFLWILSGAQSSRARSDRSVTLRIRQTNHEWTVIDTNQKSVGDAVSVPFKWIGKPTN